jgi:hypothetical protein
MEHQLLFSDESACDLESGRDFRCMVGTSETRFGQRSCYDLLPLHEKVLVGDLTEEQAMQVGKQILRDNALEVCPRLKDLLWKCAHD